MASMTINYALSLLKANNRNLTPQQFKTLRGQILAGDPAGAMRGLEKITRTRRQDREHPTRQDPGHRAGQ